MNVKYSMVPPTDFFFFLVQYPLFAVKKRDLLDTEQQSEEMGHLRF